MKLAGRDARIDFFRGFALLTIFIEHVYYNKLGGYTLRSYGIADAGEVFFFLSGFVATLANDRIVATYGYGRAQHKALSRCARIYLAHAVSFLVVVALTVLLSQGEGFGVVFSVYGLSDIAAGDWSTFVHGLMMLHQPYLFGILPVFIILSALTPVMLYTLRRSPQTLLAISFFVYLAVQLFDINLPTYPKGTAWAFNPLAYQFIFVLGMLFGWNHLNQRFRPSYSIRTMAVASMFLLLIFLLHKFIPFLHRHFLPELSWYVGGIPLSNKQNIEPMRIVHFLLLAYFVMGLVHYLESLPLSIRSMIAVLARPVASCGRHSLTVFAYSIVLSYLGSLAIASLGDGAAVWVPLNLFGVTLLLLVAAWLDRRRPGDGLRVGHAGTG